MNEQLFTTNARSSKNIWSGDFETWCETCEQRNAQRRSLRDHQTSEKWENSKPSLQDGIAEIEL